MQENSANMYNMSFAASGMEFQNLRRVPVSVFRVKITPSDPLNWRGLLEGIFELVSNFS
jgi:hypothetical protein